MTDEYVPPHLRAAMRAFEDAISDTRTRRARLERVEVPEVHGASGEEMARAAARPDAPRELKDVARAVAEGRVTWDQAARGEARAAPEVAALLRNGGDRLLALWERGQDEDRRRRDDGGSDAPR